MRKVNRLLPAVFIALIIVLLSGSNALARDDVPVPVTRIDLSPRIKYLAENARWFISAKTLPENATAGQLDWSSSDESVASIVSVSKSGAWVQAKGKVGDTALITASTTDSSGIRASCRITITAPVTDILLWTDGDVSTVRIGDTLIINCSVLPSDSSDELSWKSSDNSVATILSTFPTGAFVKFTGGGEASITCAVQDGSDVSESYDIFVEVPIESLTLPETASVFIDKKIALEPVFYPENTTDTSIRWRSERSDIASVDPYGVVTARKVGQTRIIAKSASDLNVTGECLVRITRPIAVISLSTDHTSVGVGSRTQIIASIAPYNATSKFIEWSVSDKSVATVSNTGLVTGVSLGTVMVTATAMDGSGAVGVLPITVSNTLMSMSLPSETSIYPGQSTHLQLATTPHGVDTKGFVWSSSNASAASVSNDGVVTGISVGKTQITVTSESGIKASCNVTVSEYISDINVFSPKGEVYKGDTFDIYIGEHATFSVKTQPLEAACVLKWTSSMPNVVRIPVGGALYAKKVGVSRVTVTALDPHTKRVLASKSFNARVMRPVVSINVPQQLRMLLGSKSRINAMVKPNDATNKGLVWASSDEGVAYVNGGVVTAVSTGEAMITATSDNLRVGVTRVIVSKPVESIDIIMPVGKNRVIVGDSFYLTTDVKPSNAEGAVSWKSSDKSIVSIDAYGKLTALKSGVVTITAYALDGSGAKGFIIINVDTAVESVDFSRAVVELFTNGGDDKTPSSAVLKPRIRPKSAVGKKASWSSSDESVAFVDQNGLVRAISDGICIVSVEVDGARASILIKTYTLPSYISLGVDSMTMIHGDRVSVATSAEYDGTDGYLKWKSSKKRVATVSDAGLIKAKKAGKTIISVETRNGLKASFPLTVTKKTAED